MLDAFMLTLFLQMQFQSPGCSMGDGWAFVLRGGDVDRSPRWLDTSDAPPLAPRAAVRSARSLLGRMSCSDADGWEVAAVAMRPVGGAGDVWISIVTFQEPLRPPKGSVGAMLPRVLEIPVLMDGTVLMPSVGPGPPRR